MSDAVFYNVLAWKISGDDTYANNVANFINVWFINNATYMTPNLNYAQPFEASTARTAARIQAFSICMA